MRSPLGATPQHGTYELETPRTARRVVTRDPVGTLAVAGLFAGGLLIALSAASTDALLPLSVRPIPTWLAGPFGGAGINLGGVGVMVTLGAMFLFYVIAVRRSERLSPRTVLMCVAALEALMLLAPPLLSTDVFSYGAYGRMGALYGANPYLHGPYAISLDPFYPLIGAKWGQHSIRLRSPVHGAVVRARAALDRRERAGLQGHCGALQSRHSCLRLERRPVAWR